MTLNMSQTMAQTMFRNYVPNIAPKNVSKAFDALEKANYAQKMFPKLHPRQPLNAGIANDPPNKQPPKQPRNIAL